ncbi:MAG: ABC transporter substrate-binding protein, partial [Pontibacterium sp.]
MKTFKNHTKTGKSFLGSLLKNSAAAALISLPLLAVPNAHAKSQPLEIPIAYGQYQPPKPPALSNILPEPEDAGLQGAKLGIKDNNTTGRFLKQNFSLHEMSAESGDELLAQAQQAYSEGLRLFVFNTDRPTLDLLRQTLSNDALIFNAGSYDDDLRVNQCQKNLLHTLPSRAMLADALGQWLTTRRWNNWLLIRGNQPEDLAYAQALHRAAKRFGHKIVAEKEWTFDTDLRRVAQKEVPLFTQTKEYDVVVVADERGDFGEYILYNTWFPRPVAGTQGLTPVTWHRVVEQWGAAQLQSRFEKLSKRWMTNKDYSA